MRGYFLMRRGWMDDPEFIDEPFTRAQAWIWLIENARFRAGIVTINGRQIAVARGQLCVSLRTLAAAWHWSDARVRRSLTLFKKSQKIDAASDAGQTLITICDYEDFQSTSDRADAPRDAAPSQKGCDSDAPIERIQVEPREKEEDFKNLEGAVGRSAPAREAVAEDARPPPTEAEKAEVAGLVDQVKATLRGDVLKGIHDPPAYEAAIADKRFRNVYEAVNAAAGRLDGAAQWEAYEAVAVAQEAGSWEGMSPPAADRLRELYRWVKALEDGRAARPPPQKPPDQRRARAG